MSAQYFTGTVRACEELQVAVSDRSAGEHQDPADHKGWSMASTRQSSTKITTGNTRSKLMPLVMRRRTDGSGPGGLRMDAVMADGTGDGVSEPDYRSAGIAKISSIICCGTATSSGHGRRRDAAPE